MKTRLLSRCLPRFSSRHMSSVRPLRRLRTAYPTRPIRLIVPYARRSAAPTSSAASSARSSASRSASRSSSTTGRARHQLVGTELVARSAPDGYTLCLRDVGFTINPLYYRKPRTTRSRISIRSSVVAETPYVIVVAERTFSGTVKDFIAAVKAQAREDVDGSAGNGSGTHSRASSSSNARAST